MLLEEEWFTKYNDYMMLNMIIEDEWDLGTPIVDEREVSIPDVDKQRNKSISSNFWPIKRKIKDKDVLGV